MNHNGRLIGLLVAIPLTTYAVVNVVGGRMRAALSAPREDPLGKGTTLGDDPVLSAPEETRGRLTRVEAQIATTKEVEPELEDIWTSDFIPEEGSMFALLGWDYYGEFAPTWEMFSSLVPDTVGWVDLDLDKSALEHAWQLNATREVWKEIQEHKAFRHFISDYQRREMVRWKEHQTSKDLVIEIQPAASFIESRFDDPMAVWASLSRYSEEVINQIHQEGEFTEEANDPEETWLLHDLLVSGVKTHSGTMDAILRSLRR